MPARCWRNRSAYRLVGVHEQVAFVMNTLVAAAAVWVVFLIATTMTRNSEVGGYAALIMALVPEQLRWSHTAAAEPSAALACAFGVLTALAFVRLRSTGALLWTASASVFAMQFRPEGVLVAPLVVAIVLDPERGDGLGVLTRRGLGRRPDGEP